MMMILGKSETDHYITLLSPSLEASPTCTILLRGQRARVDLFGTSVAWLRSSPESRNLSLLSLDAIQSQSAFLIAAHKTDNLERLNYRHHLAWVTGAVATRGRGEKVGLEVRHGEESKTICNFAEGLEVLIVGLIPRVWSWFIESVVEVGHWFGESAWDKRSLTCQPKKKSFKWGAVEMACWLLPDME